MRRTISQWFLFGLLENLLTIDKAAAISNLVPFARYKYSQKEEENLPPSL
jgi:hypothetical protein